MIKNYIVGVCEAYLRFYAVAAENEEEVKDLVNDRAPQVTDLDFCEYSHEMNRETWSVEENTGKPDAAH